MTEYMKVRQVIEFEVKVDEDYEWKVEQGFDPIDYTDDIKVVFTELLGERHEVDYSLGCDRDREVHTLSADGVLVFEHRDHDEVVREYGRRDGVEITLHPLGKGYRYWGQGGHFMSYGDPDKSWDILNGRV